MSDTLIGYIGVLVSVLGFGSNFIPLKRIKIGDGVFFQFMMCNGIFFTSIPVLMIQNFPEFHGLALLGGFLWCTGNMLCPISIRFIGMGLGLLIWGCTSMIMGCASGTFGLFGLKKQEISNPILNYIGVVLAIIGFIIYLNVKSDDTSLDNRIKDGASYSPLLQKDLEDSVTEIENIKVESSNKNQDKFDGDDELFGDSLSESSKRIIGLVFACIAGIFFGCSFDPAQYVIDNQYDGNDDSMNYVFAHFTGIMITSWFYTILYCAYKYYKNQKPFINSQCILPATVSGIIWGIAEITWFLANGKLGFTVTFPIISSGPGFIGSLWGIFLFKEIKGTKNFITLFLAACVTIPALILVGLSH